MGVQDRALKLHPIKRYVFYPIHMEVKENAQEQKHHGSLKQKWRSFDDYLKIA